MVARSTARYRVRKNLQASADEAYAWLTDFDGEDLRRMGVAGTREVYRLTADVYRLVDHVRRQGRKVRKEKLVHLYPRDHSWASTYVGGPTNRSQFLYQIERTGRRRCRLTFTGLQMDEVARARRGPALARYARTLRREDSATWTRLARELALALGRARRPGGG